MTNFIFHLNTVSFAVLELFIIYQLLKIVDTGEIADIAVRFVMYQ